MNLKRDVVKYIRDRAKSKYDKGTECYICKSTDRLDFHHFYSLSPLMYKWIRQEKLSEEDVVEWRDKFIEVHKYELYEAAVTICHDHHMKLHSIYGKDPPLGTAEKQRRWVDKQREKHELA